MANLARIPRLYVEATLAGGISGAFLIDLDGTVGVEETGAGVPSAPLFLAAPNPFEAATRFAYSLPRDADVALEIFDASGRLVATPVNGRRPAGANTAAWHGLDANGRPVPAGAYFARLRAGGTVRFEKIVRIR